MPGGRATRSPARAPGEPASSWTSSTTSTRSRRSSAWSVSHTAAANPRARAGLVLLGAGTGGRRDRSGRVRSAAPGRVAAARRRAPRERRERRVVRGGRVPGAVDLGRPVGEQRRLAEPGTGHDGRQPPLERLREHRVEPRRAAAAAPGRPAGEAWSSRSRRCRSPAPRADCTGRDHRGAHTIVAVAIAPRRASEF